MFTDTTPGTPEDTYRKYTGDQTIKCITMPLLKMRKADDLEDADDVTDNLTQFENLILEQRARYYDDTDTESLASSQN